MAETHLKVANAAGALFATAGYFFAQEQALLANNPKARTEVYNKAYSHYSEQRRLAGEFLSEEIVSAIVEEARTDSGPWRIGV